MITISTDAEIMGLLTLGLRVTERVRQLIEEDPRGKDIHADVPDLMRNLGTRLEYIYDSYKLLATDEGHDGNGRTRSDTTSRATT